VAAKDAVVTLTIFAGTRISRSLVYDILSVRSSSNSTS
jgi:hypothetical protein